MMKRFWAWWANRRLQAKNRKTRPKGWNGLGPPNLGTFDTLGGPDPDA